MNTEIFEALRVDERGEIGWTQLIEMSGLTEADLHELVDDGTLVPVDPAAPTWSFATHSVVVARTAARLCRDFDLDAHSLAVVLRFATRIEELQRQLSALRAGVADG
jgi:MerR HTH family regulatory protein